MTTPGPRPEAASEKRQRFGPVSLAQAHRFTPIASWGDTLDVTTAAGIDEDDEVWWLEHVDTERVNCRDIIDLDDPAEAARVQSLVEAFTRHGHRGVPPLVLSHWPEPKYAPRDLHLFDGAHRTEAAIQAPSAMVLAWVAHHDQCCPLAAEAAG